ncbi:MAG TPA: electron transfer flavoprotein subunit alpha/FixB family protein [Candidatus Marinimicrobia bacterium]|mgnify:CR=1 FL=1|jgi:electron transfer flavoprotein alpha subunit|nr:electron transfer flavoprotein subunit alpha/FixB family protein [Candidatus Neomarinimicrobiota bacterium]|tara:strand:- start:11127 stop:12098 length:972 start_codon:yes stop_codon:yes gene_type:complete
MGILVILEQKENSIHRMSLEAVAGAQDMADKMNMEISALLMGADVSPYVEKAQGLELKEVIVAQHELLNEYSCDGFSEIVRQVIEKESPNYVVMAHTYMVRDFLPRVSALSGVPFVPDVVSFQVTDGKPVFTKQMFNSKLGSDIVVNGAQGGLISFQSAAYQAESVRKGDAPVRDIEISLTPDQIRSVSEAPFQESSGGVDLTSAEVLVSVGRGIGEESKIPMAKALADAIGAELAASRPVVDSGWLPPFRQIGSSGQNVSPKLYFSVGISGAIQHVVGMKGSQNIIAINKDPEAPIFEIADYAVVGDLHEIIPRLTEALQEQ